MNRAALRLQPPVRPELRRRDSHDCRKTTWSPVRFCVSPITSADRSAASSGRPFRNGDATSAERTATISSPPPGTAL